jgi:hypothetical protein
MEWHPLANFVIAGTGSGCVNMWDVPHGNLTFFSPHMVRLLACVWWWGQVVYTLFV